VIDDAADDTPEIMLACEPLLVNSHGAAKLCNVAERTWRKLHACGLCPEPVHVGRRRLWVVSILRRWTEMGCPARHEYEMRRGAE
jgi:hypothetical protein